MAIKAKLYWIDLAKVTFVQGATIWSYKCSMFVLGLEETKGGSIKVWLMALTNYFLSMRTSPWEK
jgi:hypothetical protein